MKNAIVSKRREAVFGMAVLLSGLAITSLCLMPTVLSDTNPERLVPTAPQLEHFFFEIFGVVFGLWLLCWISAVNQWKVAAKTGQWAGIIILCAEQAILMGIWRTALARVGDYAGVWLAPLVLQTYLAGLFVGFFTLPNLTEGGNLRLTGLGTLVLLLPWLFARDAVIQGALCLNGLLL